MNIGFIIAGIIFLFNPVVNVVDILPDIIGYILIMYGMYKFTDMVNSVSGLDKNLLWLCLLSLFKVIVAVITLFIDDKGIILLVVFVDSVFETLLFIVAFNKIFKIFNDLGIYYNSKTVDIKISEVKTITYIFAIAKSILTFIPELRYLSTSDYNIVIHSYDKYSLSDFNLIFLILNISVVSIIGLIWLFYIINYFKRIYDDKDFIAKLSDSYNVTVLPNNNIFLARRLGIAVILLIVGSVFLLDINLDGIDYIPDFISAVLIISVLLIIKNDIPHNKILYKLSWTYIPVSLFNWVFQYLYAVNYFNSIAFTKELSVFILFLSAIIINAASSLILMLLFLNLSKYYIYAINNFIGIVYEKHFVKLINLEEEKREKLLNDEKLVKILSVCVAASKILQIISLQLFGWYWLIHLTIEIVWLIKIIIFLNSLNDDIQFKYNPVSFEGQ